MWRHWRKLRRRAEHWLLGRAIKRYSDHPIFMQAFLQRLGKRDVELVRKLDDHSLRFPPHVHIGRLILNKGGYHRDTFERAISAAECAGRLSPGGVLLEVGANIGTHTVYAHLSGLFEKVIAVEPSAENFRFLAFNVRENGLEHKTMLYQCAAGRADATGHLTRLSSRTAAHLVFIAPMPLAIRWKALRYAARPQFWRALPWLQAT